MGKVVFPGGNQHEQGSGKHVGREDLPDQSRSRWAGVGHEVKWEGVGMQASPWERGPATPYPLTPRGAVLVGKRLWIYLLF